MLLADQLPADTPITLIGVMVSLVGVIAWVLKSALPGMLTQWRSDVFAMMESHKADIEKQHNDHREERKEADIRHSEELSRRDSVCSKLADASTKVVDQLDRLTNRIEQLDRPTARRSAASDSGVLRKPTHGENPQ